MCGGLQVCQTTGGCQKLDSLSACSLWDASGCLLTVEQICIEILTLLLMWGYPCVFQGAAVSIFTPSLVAKGWMSLLELFSLIPEITCLVRLCSSLLGTPPDKTLPFPLHSSVGSMAVLLKMKEQTAFQIPHFWSGKLPQKSNVCCCCVVVSSPELLDSAS